MVAPELQPTPRPAGRPPIEPTKVELDVGRQIARADIPALCERARVLLEAPDADPLICNVGAVADPDAVTVDALARLQLTARRLGRQVRLEHASRELLELLSFTGLSDVVPLCDRSRIEARRQTEHREEVGRIEEEGDPADPTA